MKKLSIIILFILVFITGCSNGYNSSPDKLSEEMVKRLSNGDFKNIEELILTNDDVVITPNSFEQYLKEKDLYIKGNDLIEVVNYQKPTKDENTKKVVVKIDNNKAIEINTIKKDNKWFIDLGYDAYEELTFITPIDSIVKLDGIKLDYKKYSKILDANVKLSYSDKNAYPKMNKYKIKVLKYDYELSVSKDDFNTYKKTINKDTTGQENYGVRSTDNSFITLLEPNNNEKEKIEVFVKKYYEAMFSSINSNGNITDLKQYIRSDKFEDFNNDYSEKYNNKIEKLKKENSYSRKIYDQYTYKNIGYYKDGIYYLDDNNILVAGTVNYSYHYKFEYFGMMSSFAEKNNEDKIEQKSINVAMILSKDKSGYKINFGYNLIP